MAYERRASFAEVHPAHRRGEPLWPPPRHDLVRIAPRSPDALAAAPGSCGSRPCRGSLARSDIVITSVRGFAPYARRRPPMSYGTLIVSLGTRVRAKPTTAEAPPSSPNRPEKVSTSTEVSAARSDSDPSPAEAALNAQSSSPSLRSWTSSRAICVPTAPGDTRRRTRGPPRPRSAGAPRRSTARLR